jgi:hypothetical protein
VVEVRAELRDAEGIRLNSRRCDSAASADGSPSDLARRGEGCAVLGGLDASAPCPGASMLLSEAYWSAFRVSGGAKKIASVPSYMARNGSHTECVQQVNSGASVATGRLEV